MEARVKRRNSHETAVEINVSAQRECASDMQCVLMPLTATVQQVTDCGTLASVLQAALALTLDY